VLFDDCSTYTGGEPGTSRPGKVVIAMCLWKRPGLATDCLRQLGKTAFDGEVELRLWNNAWEYRKFYDQLVEWVKATGAFSDVSITHSQRNYYAWARFPLGALSDAEYVVTLDDDVSLRRNAITKLVQASQKWEGKSAVGGYGRILPESGDYWKSRALGLYERFNTVVNYLGTGLSIYRREWLCDERLYQAPMLLNMAGCDLWLSYVLHEQGVGRLKFTCVSLLNRGGRQKSINFIEQHAGIKVPAKQARQSMADQLGVRRIKRVACRYLTSMCPGFFDQECYGAPFRGMGE